jgi:hypothetical protein
MYMTVTHQGHNAFKPPSLNKTFDAVDLLLHCAIIGTLIERFAGEEA